MTNTISVLSEPAILYTNDYHIAANSINKGKITENGRDYLIIQANVDNLCDIDKSITQVYKIDAETFDIAELKSYSGKDIADSNLIRRATFSYERLYLFADQAEKVFSYDLTDVPLGEMVDLGGRDFTKVSATSSANKYTAEDTVQAINLVKMMTWRTPLASDCQYTISRGLSAYHNGLDLPIKNDCMITAAATGTVKFAEFHHLGGYRVIIDHGNGILTNYFHGQNDFKVKVGDKVIAGQPLMPAGCSGRCTGKHLHFELFVGGKYLSPREYISF
jgi:murein DD-endopeptidase MepM/ murein hydrolase activator NlpD